MTRPLVALLVVLSLATLAGCIRPQEANEPANEAPTPTAPSEGKRATCEVSSNAPKTPDAGQSGVSNQPGTFTYGGQVAAKTATETFLWENPSAAAQVTWGGQTGTGTLKLTLDDYCDHRVYEKELSGAAGQSGTVETTQAGQAGVWLVTLEFTLYTGQMGLSITSA